MQTLGLSDSNVRSQGRLRSLFWPSIGNDYDVDYLTRQGFWICVIVSVVTLLFSMVAGNTLAALVDVVFFFLCGIGIRVHSRVASVCAFCAYLLTGFVMTKMGVQGFSIVRILGLALLLSNIRATFLAARWVATRTEPPPPPLTASFLDRFADVMPRKVWPVGQYLFYGLAVFEFFGLLAALVLPVARLRN